MIPIRAVVTALVTIILGSATAWVSAQVPTGTARHLRAAPIRTARLLPASVGSFTAVRTPAPGISIVGIVQNHAGALVPNAGEVIVRELLTGRVVGRTQVNALAQFTLRSLPPGLYIAELVGRSGLVIASSPAFSAAMGEVIQIAQTLPAFPVAGVARVAASATTSALSAAAGSGVLALAPGVPVTPSR